MPILTEEERVGTTLGGKYRIRRILGHGGMAVIYEAVHLRTRRPVAVKILHHDFASHPDVAARFFTEARATAGLKHPNIVDVLDVGRDPAEGPDATAYLVLELLHGETWQDRIARGKVPLAECLRLLGPLMEGLEEVHRRGIVHRDLKPDNLFVHRGPDGEEIVKLLDFGLARVVESADESHRTVTGTVLGTPTFMAPEQASAKKDIGPPADVWAMAIVLYLSLTGERPYQSKGIAVILEIVKTGPRPIEEVDPSLPPELCAWIGRALRLDPAERPTMRAFLEGLCAVSGRPAEELAERTLFRSVPLEELELYGAEEISSIDQIGEIESIEEMASSDLETMYEPRPAGASISGEDDDDLSVAASLGLSLDGEAAPVTDPALLLADLDRRRGAPRGGAQESSGELAGGAPGGVFEEDPEDARTLLRPPRPDRPAPSSAASAASAASAPLSPPAQEARAAPIAPSPQGPAGGPQGSGGLVMKGIVVLVALLILGVALVLALVRAG